MATKQNAHLSKVRTMQMQGRSQKLANAQANIQFADIQVDAQVAAQDQAVDNIKVNAENAHSMIESSDKTQVYTNSHTVSHCQERLLDKAGSLSLSTSQELSQVHLLSLQSNSSAPLATDSLVSDTDSGITTTNMGPDNCGSHTFKATFSQGTMHSPNLGEGYVTKGTEYSGELSLKVKGRDKNSTEDRAKLNTALRQARHVRCNELNGASNHDVLNSQLHTLHQLHTQEPSKQDLSFKSFKNQDITPSQPADFIDPTLQHVEHPNRVKVALPQIEQTLTICPLQATIQAPIQHITQSDVRFNVHNAIDASAEVIAVGAGATQACLQFSGERLNVFAPCKSQSTSEVTVQADYAAHTEHFSEHAASRKPQTIVNVATQQGDLTANTTDNKNSGATLEQATESTEQNKQHRAKNKSSNKKNSSKNSIKEKSVTKKPQSKLSDAEQTAVNSQLQSKQPVEARIDETATVVQELDADKSEPSFTTKGRSVAQNKDAVTKRASYKRAITKSVAKTVNSKNASTKEVSANTKEVSANNETKRITKVVPNTSTNAVINDAFAKSVTEEQQVSNRAVKSQSSDKQGAKRTTTSQASAKAKTQTNTASKTRKAAASNRVNKHASKSNEGSVVNNDSLATIESASEIVSDRGQQISTLNLEQLKVDAHTTYGGNTEQEITSDHTSNTAHTCNTNHDSSDHAASGFAAENSSAIWPMFGWEHLRPAHRVTYQDVEPRYLELLATKYPNRVAAFSEIINLQAILNLPKGTEHFVSDIHGEYDAFRHILNNCSGVIKEKVDLLFTDLSADKKADLCTLIYYPQEVLSDLESRGLLTAGWYREVLSRLISLCKYLSAKYTRSKVRKAINSDYAYIIDELLHAQEGESNSRALYHSKIIDTILHIHAAYHFVTSLCALSKRLAVDHLHVVGDIFDRGANPDKVMSLLMDYHSLDIQWGNHDILWMGAACGSEACMATVLRNNINYFNCNLLESAYGISLRKLNDFAQRTYRSPVKELSSINAGASSNDACTNQYASNSGPANKVGNTDADNKSGNAGATNKASISNKADTINSLKDINSQSLGRKSNCALCADANTFHSDTLAFHSDFAHESGVYAKTPEEQIQWISLVLGYSEKKLQGLDNHQLQLVYQYAMEQAQLRIAAQVKGHAQDAAAYQASLLEQAQSSQSQSSQSLYAQHHSLQSQSSNSQDYAAGTQQEQSADSSMQDADLQAAKIALGKSGTKLDAQVSEGVGENGQDKGANRNSQTNPTHGVTTIINATAHTSDNVVASECASVNLHRPDDYDPHHATAQALLDEYEVRSKSRKNKKNDGLESISGKKKPMKLKALVKMLEKAQEFKPAFDDTYEHSSQISKDKMVKAITVIALKLQGQLILRNPEFNMNDRLLLDKMDLEHGTVTIDGKTYQLNTTDLPTIDPEHPFELSAEEAEVMQRIKESFLNSRELQREVGFLFSHGSIYKRFNGNLLYHGCVPMTEDGQFKQINCHGRVLSGKAFLDYCESVARRAYDKHDEQSLDFMYFLWCGINSPLSGRIMKPFERYFIDDKSSHVEPRDPYYSFYYREDTCRKVLSEFNLDPDTGHIINGHTPIKVKQGESPIRGNGKLLVIDGGLCSAYHSTTGIAGYTLIFSSHGLTLQAHRPFVSTQEAISKKLDIESVSNEVEHYTHRLQVADSDTGIKLKRAIFELEALLDAYRQGILPETSNTSR